MIDLYFPKSWELLSQQQLRHVFTCIAAGYTADEIKTCALIRWNELDILLQDSPHTYLVKKAGKIYKVSSAQIAALLPQLDFLTEIPPFPVRLEEIKGHKALPTDFQEVPFEKFIMCDNLYQGYLHTKNPDLAAQLAGVLYNDNNTGGITKAQEVSIFYWWTSLKHYFGNMFPNFFKPVVSEDPTLGTNLYHRLSDSMNAQIRALTKGDITKEKEVLAMDTWRALTELNAQAKEYEELKQSQK